ncbi:hypothetical protein BOO69_07585 [Sulfitobacter alexandrii]|uniref:Primosomal protein N' (Replication factor Y)-superfamily II helicase n=1 Tax=Sulfitobacter alexandrii TaxID=1917485 RepID=A0A1J0WGI2_9RHOB|nr:hypothetical protein [Sulfitobacter alexandrii]APE43296.1 hypothetical protein BOO69_07585 [Sulfitobacter alexandrii]
MGKGAPDHVTADQAALSCPNCGAHCVFSPSDGALRCTSCGSLSDLDSPWDATAAREFPYAPDDAETTGADLPDVSHDRTHQCRNCGGAVLFIGPALSTDCPYCNGPVVLAPADVGYRTTALIPFRIEQAAARTRMRAWVGRRLAAPRALPALLDDARLVGIYAPFWTFDSHEALEYWARYTTGSGDRRRTHSTSGALQLRFDDLLMPASPHVTAMIRDGILHDFDPAALKPYRVGYLAGFAAERHHQSVAQGLTANAPDKKLLIRNRIRQHIGRSGVHAIRFQTDTTGIRYRRILLPVWIAHYTWRGRPMKVVVSGIDGRTFGERPFSRVKLACYAAALSAAAIALGLAWGAGGLL